MKIKLSVCLLGGFAAFVLLLLTSCQAQLHRLHTLAMQSPPQQFAELGDLKLESGQTIHNCRLGYRTVGTLNADKSNAVLFPTWFSGRSSNIVDLTGPGKIVDSAKYFVVIIDALGDGVSCSPSTSKDQHGIAFPEFSVRDMVNAEHRLATESLHLNHLHAVMGISMGGMQTFQWMVSYPDFMDKAVPIVGTPQQSAYDVMLWRSEATALQADPAWNGGRYSSSPSLPMVALLHDMNLTTPQYRVEHTSYPESGKYFEEVRSKGIGSFDANDWLWQLKAMLQQDVSQGGALEDAAKKVKAKVLVISARQDHMVDPIPALKFAGMLHAQTLVLESDCGHLSPGCEGDKVSAAVDRFLAEP